MRAMKDSGVSWIGEIPIEWETAKFKNVFLLRKGLSITKADVISEGIAVISYGQIHAKINTGTSINNKLIRYVDDNYLNSDSQALVHLGDFIFADTSEDYDGIGNCVYVDRNDKIFAGYHTIIAHSNEKIHPKYLAYLFLTNCWRSQLRSIASGIKVFSITQRMLKTTSIILPSNTKIQQRIADYLDTRCAKIDTLISQEQTVIEKLKEYKQSMITQAVTKGLNPDVPMKDSGVDWIGDIPADWKISKIKYVAYFNPTVDKKLNNEDIVGYVPMDCLQCGYMLPKKIQVDKATSGLTAFLTGDIIMAKVTPCFENGEIAIAENLVNGMGLGSSELFIFRCFGINSKFLFYILQNSNLKHQCIATMTGVGGLKRVSPFFMKNSVIPLPPNDVQNKIVNGLNNLCSAIDATISKKQTLIDKLTEYKKSLIYEVVTGKKEV